MSKAWERAMGMRGYAGSPAEREDRMDRGYSVFVRNWWKANPAWPNGLEPHMGKKRYLERNISLEEARRVAKDYNDTHKPGRFSRKAEIEVA